MSQLGRRQPEIYGTTTPAELDAMLQAHARDKRDQLEVFYTHIEGEAIARLYRSEDEGFDGVVMNPAGFTYAGPALRDCVQALPFPCVEVRMTNLAKRGLNSALAVAAIGTIAGFGLQSDLHGLEAMLQLLSACG
jgi:3-dehydroquinate dehydratase-2